MTNPEKHTLATELTRTLELALEKLDEAEAAQTNRERSHAFYSARAHLREANTMARTLRLHIAQDDQPHPSL